MWILTLTFIPRTPDFTTSRLHATLGYTQLTHQCNRRREGLHLAIPAMVLQVYRLPYQLQLVYANTETYQIKPPGKKTCIYIYKIQAIWLYTVVGDEWLYKHHVFKNQPKKYGL